MSKTFKRMSTELKEQVQNAASADILSCGHKGKCKTCPTCKAFNTDGFPPVTKGDPEKEEVFFSAIIMNPEATDACTEFLQCLADLC